MKLYTGETKGGGQILKAISPRLKWRFSKSRKHNRTQTMEKNPLTMPMFIAALLRITQIWKRLKYWAESKCGEMCETYSANGIIFSVGSLEV